MNIQLLKNERELRGWSQAKIAEALGINARTVIRWEKGQAIPYPYYRERLCDLFGKNARELGLVLDDDEGEMTEMHEQQSGSSPVNQPLFVRSPSYLIDSMVPEALGRAGNLLGRAQLLSQIQQRLFEGDRLALHGLPGVGKTALAVTLAINAEVQARFPDGILWAGLGPHPNVLSQLARWGSLLGILPRDVENSGSQESWARTLQAFIGSRRMLLIIDDAWTAEEALALQVGGSQCAHLLLTRLPQVALAFAQENLVVVPEIKENDGLALLAGYVPRLVQRDRERALALVKTVGGLPLALTLIGKYLAVQEFAGQPRRLQTALTRLHDAEQRLRLSIPVTVQERPPNLPGDVPVSLYATIAVSDQHLSPEARTMFCHLALFAPKPNSFSEEAALAVSGQPVEALDELWDAGILECSNAGRYTMHQTIADYAHTRQQDPEARRRLVRYMLSFLETHAQDYEALEDETVNILTALDTAIALHMQSEIVQGSLACVSFLRAWGLYSSAIAYFQQALQTTLAQENALLQIPLLHHLAAFSEARGDYEQAERCGQEGLTLARRFQQTDGECDMLIILGIVAYRRGEYVQARPLFEKGLYLARRLDDSERICTFLCYLGRIAHYQIDYVQAEAHYQEGLMLARRGEHQELLSLLLGYLAAVLREQGKYEHARQPCLEGLVLARQMKHREYQSRLLDILGAIAWEEGHWEQAEQYFQDALEIARQIEQREQICRILANLGTLLTFPNQDKYVEAEGYLQEGITLARQIENHSILPHLLMSQGATIGASRPDDYELANSYFQESITLSRNQGASWESTAALMYWGLHHLQHQQLEPATSAFQEVLSLASTIRVDPQLVAISQYGLAMVAAARGDFAEAQRLGRLSEATLESLGHYYLERVRAWLQLLPEVDS
jgi:tetratricopeptide (TPR) repeat protein/transcriptional regulator with XRE-family HTH domain